MIVMLIMCLNGEVLYKIEYILSVDRTREEKFTLKLMVMNYAS